VSDIYTGYDRVTRASLQVKDRTVYPPDRVLFSYHVVQNKEVILVEGSWGDYLRDIDKGLVVKGKAPLNESENAENAMLITDLYPGIPDRTFIPDPTLPL
jgi:hypothetical protein